VNPQTSEVLIRLVLIVAVVLIVAPIIAFVSTKRGVINDSKLARVLSWSLRIASLVPWLCVVSLGAWFAATSRDHDPDVTKWVEVLRPTEPAEHDILYYAMDSADAFWVVTKDGGKVKAHLFGWREFLSSVALTPPFLPRAENFSNYKAFHVSDGWLVGFNEGEFGAALYWFSNSGLEKYKVSDDQVEDFLPTPTGLIAIQGLAHGDSDGSIVRLDKNEKNGRWISSEVKHLPAAPQAVMRADDGRLFLALSDSLVVLTPDNQLETLVKPTDWVRADSIVTSADGSKIYVGTLQYVFEYDTQTKRHRYLVPDLSFVHKLSREKEEHIRKSNLPAVPAS